MSEYLCATGNEEDSRVSIRHQLNGKRREEERRQEERITYLSSSRFRLIWTSFPTAPKGKKERERERERRKRERARERERVEAFTFVVSALAFEHIQTERGTPVFLVNLLANPLTGYLVRRRLKQLVLVLVLVAWFPWRSALALPLPLPQWVPP